MMYLTDTEGKYVTFKSSLSLPVAVAELNDDSFFISFTYLGPQALQIDWKGAH